MSTIIRTNYDELSRHEFKNRHGRKNSFDDLSVGTCSTASLSDHDSTHSSSVNSTSADTITSASPQTTKRRRRVRAKKNKSTKSQKSNIPQEPALTQAEKGRYLAMDCEMVETVGQWGQPISVLARVTIINWEGETVLDEYVRPDCVITDYRTAVSGILPSHLLDAMDLSDVRKRVASLIADKIVVGHALKNDFMVLGIRHPWQLTRDTAKYEPFMKSLNEDSTKLWPRKLKDLAACKLQRDIQQADRPHCPIEDALAALDLYKKARCKWEKAMEYKIQRTAQILAQQQEQ